MAQVKERADDAMANRQQAAETLAGNFEQDIAQLNETLRVNESFDLLTRTLHIGGRKAQFYLIDGFAKDDLMEKVMQFLLGLKPEQLAPCDSTQAFADHFIPYTETDVTADVRQIVTSVLSGTVALLVEGYSEAMLIDARTYPARSVEEPDDDRVLRGAHDGFVETLVMNTALIRRRLRDPALTMKYVQVTEGSRADVVLCYLAGKADPKLVAQTETELKNVRARTLTLGQASISESLMHRQWYNPFPRVRYTERPDTAAACVAEGKVLLITDNSPSVMILQSTVFDFAQDTNDFYFPPVAGTYLRLVRILVFLTTLLLTPTWYLLIRNPDWIPGWLEFIKIQEGNSVPVLLQLLLIEFILDGLKLASLNTPGALSNSFSVVSALILGDFAISSGWVVPETVLYMAFIAIGTFTQPSFELGYAFKMCRIAMLVLIAIADLWGLLAGIALTVVLAATTHPIGGGHYLAPLIPFNGRDLLTHFIRRPIGPHNT